MSEEDKAAVRKIALGVIADYRDRGCPEPEPIGAELLGEMMQWLVCEPVPEEYVRTCRRSSGSPGTVMPRYADGRSPQRSLRISPARVPTSRMAAA
jgi:4-hydroxyacetophenone monooxygenase